MNYLYCQTCFKKTAQISDMVKFCSHCGKPFNESLVSTPSKPTYTQPTNSTTEVYRQLLAKRGIKIEDDDEEEEGIIENEDGEDILSVPDIKKLNVDVDIDRNKGFSVRSLAQGAAPRKPRSDTVKPKKRDKNFLKNYLKSAAALRPK